ncbi:hypothetical protein [Bizionia arctica]|uniref:Dihydrolipoamide dehydrogenase n=1 Tax=Bizionia arctica TaxID=1495645 RepID=A0A917GGZ9_9FLAO|nr:hypothetical protein [Bizionia arctica]GGG45149.1 hypothetical protein GCM10010976_15930 [Bizionia arctica]
MKNLSILFIALLSVVFSSCEGPQGPPGNDGGIIIAPAFEIEVDFNALNNYEYFEAYGFEIYPYDMTLVYILWEVNNGQDVWRLMPQTVEFDEGSLTYNFDFTRTDVRFFLDGTINLNTLDPSWTQNQVFRVVIVPADNIGKRNFEDLTTVMEAYNIESFEKR